MNLYVTQHDGRLGHICANTNAHLTDAEGVTVGFVTSQVADWLVSRGVAMDLTPKVGA